MQITTTDGFHGFEIAAYAGVVTAHVVEGINAVRDIASNITDFVGGRSSVLEKSFHDGVAKGMKELRESAEKLGANAIVGIRFDHQFLHGKSSMAMVSVTGTAVQIRRIGSTSAAVATRPVASPQMEPDPPARAAPQEPRVMFPGMG